MAVSLCSDWGTMERAMVVDNNSSIEMNGAFHHQYPLPDTLPLGLFGSCSLDTLDLPFLERLSNGDPGPDDYLLYPSSDPHHLISSPQTSHAADSYTAAYLPDLCTAYGEFDAYGPSGLLFCANAYGEVPSDFLGPQFLSELTAFPFQVGKPEAAAALQAPPPAAAVGLPAGTGGYAGGTPTSGAGGGCPSAQSVAARQRRKRISEKTHELGQLVPGGSRMNTAEMLQSAFKYVKFLQAQVAMLDLMRSLQPDQQLGHLPLLPALLGSPAMQEKLASEERCVVPASTVRALLMDKEIKSHPSICSDLRGLTSSTG
ncbi:hypothetical protein Taro_039169 [Colocasia esculenta]|uniref:BHLH domain-containing protein n=1 Tax=Colocasia esculenta TaxID=4460 RepID=A0A843WEY6_COLES|nr:hypothetical protein [Colocasia esculenta]